MRLPCADVGRLASGSLGSYYFLGGAVAGFAVAYLVALVCIWPCIKPQPLVCSIAGSSVSDAPLPQHRAALPASRVAVAVLAQPEAHAIRTASTLRTWGARVPNLVFMTTEPIGAAGSGVPLGIPAHYLKGVDEAAGPTAARQTALAMIELREEVFPNADWYMKLDDGAFLFFDNLLDTLQHLDAADPVVIGRWVSANVSFLSSQAGYVFSRAALDILIPELRAEAARLRRAEHQPPEGKFITGLVNKTSGAVRFLDHAGFFWNTPQEAYAAWVESDYQEGRVRRPVTFHRLSDTDKLNIEYLTQALPCHLGAKTPN